MHNLQLLMKYGITENDFTPNNIDKVKIKIKAETIISSFMIIENTLSELMSPEQSELIESTKNKILKYLDDNFLK